MDDIAKLGVTHVWINPPSDAGSAEGYLPRRLNNLTSCYGSQEDLVELCKAFNKKKIICVVDIVVNHRVGCHDWADFCEPAWSSKSVCASDEWPGEGKGNKDTGEDFNGGRDLDHTQEEVQNGIIKWENEVLKPIFGGIRFDFVKGFYPKYFGLYANAFKGDFCVGELWSDLDLNNPNPHRQKLVDWVDGTGKVCGAFDFTTKGILNVALKDASYWRLRDKDGKPSGMIGWWPAMSVTFTDNHDTGPAESCTSGQNLWPIPCEKITEAYAYIMTHPGIPTIYYPHAYDMNHREKIACLTKARKSAAVTSTSPVEIHVAEQGLYAATISGNSKKLAMKMGPKDWSPSGGKLLCSGDSYAVWKL